MAFKKYMQMRSFLRQGAEKEAVVQSQSLVLAVQE